MLGLPYVPESARCVRLDWSMLAPVAGSRQIVACRETCITLTGPKDSSCMLQVRQLTACSVAWQRVMHSGHCILRTLARLSELVESVSWDASSETGVSSSEE